MLQSAMQDKGLTQVALADLANTTQTSISRYLRGAGMPRAEELHRLSIALGVSMEWLLTGEDPDGAPPAASPPPGKPAAALQAIAKAAAELEKARRLLDS